MNPTVDDTLGNPPPQNQSPWAGVDPVIAALLASGAPVQAPQSPAPPPLVPQEAPLGPPGLTQPLPSPSNDLGAQAAPVDPYTAPAPVEGKPVNPYGHGPATPVAPTGAKAIEPLKSGDVARATTGQSQAINEGAGNLLSSELAKADALAAHANTKASIFEGHATAQGLVDQQYQRARESARRDAEAETAAWMRDVNKKVSEEPVPGRWFAKQGTFGQVMYLLSLAFGSAAQSKDPRFKNIGLELIVQEINADMADQREKLKRQVDALKLRGGQIDRKLADKLVDSRDDHSMLSSRFAMIQQAAMERANAPGAADQKLAMAEAARWAGEQRLAVAGQRVERAYHEREGQLNRDAENARAYLTDKRTRDIAGAEIQKDYDLARLSANVKLEGRDAERFKDTRVLNPSITGIRVVDTSGKPVTTPVSPTGGLVVSTKNAKIEENAIQDAQMAQDRFALLNRVSKILGQDDDVATLLKRNPQLVSDLQKLGYQQARENDPRGIVTDKDLISGMESALGGDLNSLSGRIASSTFSAGQGKLKEVVDKAIRDMPAKVSNRLGTLLDAGIPGYEGNVRVDWTPKAVEIGEPGGQTTQQIDASYGIKTPIKPPQTVGDLENAQAMEKKGVQSLPPYKPGSQDKVLKALEDFKGALPGTIQARAGKLEAQLDEAGDSRASLEVQQAQYKAVHESNERLREVSSALRTWANLPKTGDAVQRRGLEHGEDKALGHVHSAPPAKGEVRSVEPSRVAELARYHGLTQLTAQDVLDIIERAGLKPGKAKE